VIIRARGRGPRDRPCIERCRGSGRRSRGRGAARQRLARRARPRSHPPGGRDGARVSASTTRTSRSAARQSGRGPTRAAGAGGALARIAFPHRTSSGWRGWRSVRGPRRWSARQAIAKGREGEALAERVEQRTSRSAATNPAGVIRRRRRRFAPVSGASARYAAEDGLRGPRVGVVLARARLPNARDPSSWRPPTPTRTDALPAIYRRAKAARRGGSHASRTPRAGPEPGAAAEWWSDRQIRPISAASPDSATAARATAG